MPFGLVNSTLTKTNLQLVGKVAQELARLQKRQNKFESGDEIVDYKRIKPTTLSSSYSI